MCALLACSGDGTGPVEAINRRRALAHAAGIWGYQGDSGVSMPPFARPVITDTLDLLASGAAIWHIVVPEPLVASGRAEFDKRMLWSIEDDTIHLFTSCSRDPRCDDFFPEWVGTIGPNGELTLRLWLGSSNERTRAYRRETR
jgi:hypothetical protein